MMNSLSEGYTGMPLAWPVLSVFILGVFCSCCGDLPLDQFFGAAIDIGKIKGYC